MRLLQDPQLNAALSVGAVLLSAALSAFVTYKVTSRSIQAAKAEGTKQRDHDSSERLLDREHEKSLSREQLLHQTKRDAYVMIQRYLAYWDRYALAHSTRFVLALDPSDEKPPVIGEDAEALANLIASGPVNAAVREVQSHISSLQLELQTANDFEFSMGSGIPDARQQWSSAKNRSRQAALDAVKAIAKTKDLMRTELLANSDRYSLGVETGDPT